MPTRRPLIAVHGFMFDPADKGGSNDPAGFFRDMQGLAGRPVDGFGWYSVPFGLRLKRPFHSAYQTARAWMSAWLSGFPQPYAYAYRRAERAAAALAYRLDQHHGPVDIVAHSLGVRVALLAIAMSPPSKVRRVILFNGAMLADEALSVVGELQPGAQILNVRVTSDRVLGWLGSRFSGKGRGGCVGQAGIWPSPRGWTELVLDDAKLQSRAWQRRQWTLQAHDGSDLFGDHFVAYHFAGNTDLVRAWLNGDDLADLVTP